MSLLTSSPPGTLRAASCARTPATTPAPTPAHPAHSALHASPGSDADAGPTHLAVRLQDDTPAWLRPLGDGENGPLEAVFAGMSPAARLSRYLVGFSRLPSSYRRTLTAVDGDRHVAWLAEVAGRPAGIARYFRLPEAGVAEFAFEVVDDHHGRGLAGLLLEAVATVAVDHTVTTLRASLAPDNVASRRLVTKFGGSVRRVDGLLEAEGSLRLPTPAGLDREEVLRLQRLQTPSRRAAAR